MDPLKCKGFPLDPTPFSPVHKALKFSAVLGTLSLNNLNTIRPARRKNLFNKLNSVKLVHVTIVSSNRYIEKRSGIYTVSHARLFWSFLRLDTGN